MRNGLQNLWFRAKPETAVGQSTYGWIHHALCSVQTLRTQLEEIKTPCLLAYAGKEVLVDNAAIKEAAKLMPNTELIEFKDSYHEILIERDEIRNKFLKAFYSFVEQA